MRPAKNQSFLVRLGFALTGVAHGLHSEYSFRFQAVALLGVIVVLTVFHLEPLWWALVGVSSASVLAAELFNTALEHLVDHLHPQAHPQIRIVKDCAAGGVLLAACGALGVAAALVVHLVRFM